MSAAEFQFTADQKLKRRIEMVAWALYALFIIGCLGRFAGRPFITAVLLASALAAFIYGRPYIRTLAVAAFLFPVLGTLIFYYGRHPHPTTRTIIMEEPVDHTASDRVPMPPKAHRRLQNNEVASSETN